MSAQLINFEIRKHWRMASDDEINTVLLYYNYERQGCEVLGKEFTLGKEEKYRTLLMEADRRRKCGNENIINHTQRA